jgi:AbrB family looped-hinge helix DNA binding protein
MRTTIDGAGRLVVPKRLRDRLALVGGAEVEVTERDGVIEVRPAPVEVRLEESEGGPVAHAAADLPALTDHDVRDVLEQLRR